MTNETRSLPAPERPQLIEERWTSLVDENRETGLGQRFAKAAGHALRRVLENPELGTRMTSEVRRIVLRTFPYSFQYLIEPKRLVVLSVFHAFQDPGQLRSRY